MTNKREKEILDTLNGYRAAYRALYGDEMGDKMQVWYDAGWCYLQAAVRYPDGSIGFHVGPNALKLFRLNQLREQADRLRRQKDMKRD